MAYSIDVVLAYGKIFVMSDQECLVCFVVMEHSTSAGEKSGIGKPLFGCRDDSDILVCLNGGRLWWWWKVDGRIQGEQRLSWSIMIWVPNEF